MVLNKALTWYQQFANHLLHLGFVITKNDYSPFTFHQGTGMAYSLLYVNDIIFATFSDSLREGVITKSKIESSMSHVGFLSYFFRYCCHTGSIFMLFLQ